MGDSNLVSEYARLLNFPISAERLESYRPFGGDDLAMITTYCWNIALCESLYGLLNEVEVSLRNSIHAALTARYGTDTWYELPNVLEH